MQAGHLPAIRQPPLKGQYEGESIGSACSDASLASVSPHYNPSRTGIKGLAGDMRAFSTFVEIMAYAGMLIVAPRAPLLTVECSYPCKPMRKVYVRMLSTCRQAAHLHMTRLCKPPAFTTCARDHSTDSTSHPHDSLTPCSQVKMAAATDISFWR